MCAVYRFLFLPDERRVTPRRQASEINSRTCAWHDPGRLQVNAMRPDAQRLQSATCWKQPGARRCRRAAGGRCVTICSFFPSYFRPSRFISSFIISRQPARMYVASKTSIRPQQLEAPQPILNRNFQTRCARLKVSISTGMLIIRKNLAKIRTNKERGNDADKMWKIAISNR